MRAFGIIPTRTTARRLSRAQAFAAQGITLKYPARSWSGVRFDDGAVMLAIREREVQHGEEGFSCLLWAPVFGEVTGWLDRVSKAERLQHCRLAALRGRADGLLVCGQAALVEPDSVLALRVEQRGREYWATWGFAARMQMLGVVHEAAAAAFFEARCAA